MARKLILVSMDEKFAKKFIGMINNINAVNNDKENSVVVENFYDEKNEGVFINESISKK